MGIREGQDIAGTEKVLREIEELLRTLPSEVDFRAESDDILLWRAASLALVSIKPVRPDLAAIGPQWSNFDLKKNLNYKTNIRNELFVLLHQVRRQILLERDVTTGTSVEAGKVFDYFNDVRRRIGLAVSSLYFVDPYLDADFVARFLAPLDPNLEVRLLTSNKRIGSLLPAVDTLSSQTKMAIQVREAPFHDRYVFIDNRIGVLSSASFKDGGKSPAALIEVMDQFVPLLQQYENIWLSAKVHR